MKRAVITGPTGAIGRALIKLLIENGYEVLAVVHRSSPRAAELEHMAHCRVLRLDLCEYDRAIEALERQGIERDGYELFFHLAWMASFGRDRDNLELQLDNIRASLAAVQFANALGCSTFIGIGSQAEYGRVEGILSPDTPAFPETGYGIAKLCAGQLTRLACEQTGLKHIWCRVLSVYGPYDRDQTLIGYAVNKMLNNEDTEFSPCDQMWDYIYSDDAARAILLSGQAGESGRVYMIGSGKVQPLKAYIQQIAEITDYRKAIGFGKRPYNDKQVMYLQADTAEIEKLGFKPEYAFEEGILRIVQHKRNGQLFCDARPHTGEQKT